MAVVQLGRYEAEEGELPPICINCGKPAAAYRARNFSWRPFWCYLFLLLTFWPYLLAAPFLTVRMRIILPFCDQHRGFWSSLRLRFLASIFMVMLTIAVGLVILSARAERDRNILIDLWLLSWIAGVVWFFGGPLLRSNAVRPTEITEETITLTDVSGPFVEQLRRERAESGAGPMRKPRQSEEARFVAPR